VNLVRKLFLKLSCRNKINSYESKANKDNDDPANVLYETFEHGNNYPKQEISTSICQMKHRNEL